MLNVRALIIGGLAVLTSSTIAHAAEARLAAVINTAGGVEWGFGVEKVRKPGTGIYCIRPKASTNINVSKAVTVATIDYTGSNVVGFILLRSSRLDCGQRDIEILTFNSAQTLADVQFNIVVH